MPGLLHLTNVRLLDLATGAVGEPTDLHVAGEVITRVPNPGATTIDCRGGIVMPGLWDAHVHMSQWATCARWVDVSTADSALEVAAIIAEAADRVDDEVLIGFGFRDSTWPHPASAQALDAVTGNRPCAIISGDVHSVWVNSAAIQHFGLGDCDGMLREEAAFDLQTRLQQVDDAVLDQWITQAANRAAELGVVGIVDLTMDWNIGHWQRRFSQGFRTLCVRAATYPQFLDRLVEEGFRGGQVLDEDKLLAVGPLKVISDGALSSGTAWCHEPYMSATRRAEEDEIAGAGACNVPLDELVELMARANQQGLQCAVHAIGDRALTQALDAFEETGALGSIEHAQLVRPDDIERMAELGLRASVQPAHLLDDRPILDELWADRAENAFPLRSLADAGVEVVLGSDAPVAPLDPWLAIEAAVRRASGDDEPWHPEQQLTLSQALLASTRGVGALVAGAEADLIVLDQNPFEVPVEQLHTMRPVLTVVGGHITCDKLGA